MLVTKGAIPTSVRVADLMLWDCREGQPDPETAWRWRAGPDRFPTHSHEILVLDAVFPRSGGVRVRVRVRVRVWVCGFALVHKSLLCKIPFPSVVRVPASTPNQPTTRRSAGRFARTWLCPNSAGRRSLNSPRLERNARWRFFTERSRFFIEGSHPSLQKGAASLQKGVALF